MPIYLRSPNILLPDNWTAGSGGFTGFNQNGDTVENQRVTGTDPWGNSAIVWESRPSGNGNADGGWNSDSYSIDEYSLYRFSVWVKRTSDTTGGTSYFGTQSNFGQVYQNVDGSANGNPYWECSNIGNYTKDTWYLVVGHVYPSNYVGSPKNHPDTGRYLTSGRNGDVNYCNISNDLRWQPGTTTTYHRTYHYYCGDSTSHLQWFDPRIDKCDGSEPTITQLLAGPTPKAQIQTSSVISTGASLKHQKVVATGGTITTIGDWKIHRFNSSGTFTITSLLGTSLLPVEYLIVAGGGGGGMDMGGGGGGGGVLNGNMVLNATSYTITVGGGGAGAPAAGTNGQPSGHQYTIRAVAGSNSSFNGLTAIGGGYGASSYYGYTPDYGYPGAGGSGGGPSGYSDGSGRSGGAGTAGQGNSGGGGGGQYYSGGGGGAGAVGTSSTAIANGGIGKQVGILGRPFYWGGGGAGAGYSTYGGAGGDGGGGGAAPNSNASNYGHGGRNSIEWGRDTLNSCTSCWAQTPGGNGGTNTGGGGGGGSHYNSNNKGGDGGSGIVIIRYKFR